MLHHTCVIRLNKRCSVIRDIDRLGELVDPEWVCVRAEKLRLRVIRAVEQWRVGFVGYIAFAGQQFFNLTRGINEAMLPDPIDLFYTDRMTASVILAQSGIFKGDDDISLCVDRTV